MIRAAGSLKTMKFSRQFNRDWDFYLSQIDPAAVIGAKDFSAQGKFAAAFDPDGVDAKTAFWNYDSKGVVVQTTEPDIAAAVVACKGRLVQVTCLMWAQDLVAGIVMADEIMEWSSSMPKWVCDNAFQTAKKIAVESIGFVPRFVMRPQAYVTDRW
jgi:hypothetical protein